MPETELEKGKHCQKERNNGVSYLYSDWEMGWVDGVDLEPDYCNRTSVIRYFLFQIFIS